MTRAGLRRLLTAKAGTTLLETVVAMAVTLVAVPIVFTGTVVVIRATDKADDRAFLIEMGQSQMESILQQPYQENAANYQLISDLAAGYTVTISASQPVTYTLPNLQAPQEVLQQITVTVVGKSTFYELSRYKLRR